MTHMPTPEALINLSEKPLGFTVHSNGSSARDLRKQYAAVHSICETLREQVGKLDIHMRDYYPLPEGEATHRTDCENRMTAIQMLNMVRDWSIDGAIRAYNMENPE